MHLKTRSESEELQILQSLHNRMSLSEQERQYFNNLKKGYEGEKQFDRLISDLECENIVLSDLLLKTNNTLFQVDSILLLPNALYLFEVKNYEGEFFYEDDVIYKKPKVEILNPLNQLNRTESLLRQLIHQLGLNFRIEAWVVFINPQFTLFQAPMDKPIILPTQLTSFIRKLNAHVGKISTRHKVLAKKLISLHQEKSPYSQKPVFKYEDLKKGITCRKCSSFSVIVEGRKCVCLTCEYAELTSEAIFRSVKAFKLLFPEKKITTKVIYDWCGGVVTKKSIRTTLTKNFKKVGTNRWIYFE